ncbi:hypothetical protein PPBDW_I20131 [Photobacterium kishitanii]|nr:hypothetical protein PPBDW_I20131 [Photobacterium kishitanii]
MSSMVFFQIVIKIIFFALIAVILHLIVGFSGICPSLREAFMMR